MMIFQKAVIIGSRALLVLILATNCFGQWGYLNSKAFELPDSIAHIQNADSLKRFIKDDDMRIRFWGIKRLGQIATQKDLSELFYAYDYEPLQDLHGCDFPPPYIKMEAIHAIAEVGGFRAESLLIKILDEIMPPKTTDSWALLPTIYDALGKFGDIQARVRLEDIYYDTKNNYHRDFALKNLYLIELKESRYSTIRDTVTFLINKLTGHFCDNITQPENYIITEAVHHIFWQIGSERTAVQLERAIGSGIYTGEFRSFLLKLKWDTYWQVKEQLSTLTPETKKRLFSKFLAFLNSPYSQDREGAAQMLNYVSDIDPFRVINTLLKKLKAEINNPSPPEKKYGMWRQETHFLRQSYSMTLTQLAEKHGTYIDSIRARSTGKYKESLTFILASANIEKYHDEIINIYKTTKDYSTKQNAVAALMRKPRKSDIDFYKAAMADSFEGHYEYPAGVPKTYMNREICRLAYIALQNMGVKVEGAKDDFQFMPH